MKRLLFVNNNLHIGGVQRALVDLLWSLEGAYALDLLLFAPCGPLLEELPPGVRLIKAGFPYRCLGMTRRDAAQAGARLTRAALAGLTRTAGRDAMLRLCDRSGKRLGGYDAAISYLHDGLPKAFYGGCNDFVLRHVEAPRRIAFLHCDHAAFGIDPGNRVRYAAFDRIAACSEGCRRSFLTLCPELEARTRVVPNCHRFAWIRERADAAPMRLRRDVLNVLTVARLGREKGVDRALEALRGLDAIHYWLVGDGAERAALERQMRAAGLEDRVTFCGERSEPYGYMRAADLLLIPSRHEAAPLVIEEAASLGTPVLTTCTSSAREMVAECGLGWVCENSTAGIAAALRELSAHPERLQRRREALAGIRFDNGAALEAFRRLVEE